ncbi:MAG: TonB-dependent receptor [Acidobacteria bacterium]|nr:TonB-dependent receptor [Acidobacteriota bacterium]
MTRHLAALVVAVVATPLLAGTTGKLSGTVADEQGLALPGVTITVTSPALIGGPRMAVTEGDGTFSFPALDPGSYAVRAELTGFVGQERSEVQVRLDRTTELNVIMPMAKFGEEVTVVAETPVVDPTQVSTSQTFTNDYLKYAAIGSANRGYQNVLTQTAGVAGDDNPNVFGSTLGENAYFVDGLDTTDPVTATWGTNFNFDAIQEISFQTGGFEAEYGRATGGVVNLITKSGGNDFSGTFDIRYRSTSFYQNGDHFDRDTNPTKFMNPAMTLGGPLLRDSLWFFTSFEDIASQQTPAGSPATRDYNGQNYIGKLTWQLNPNWRIVGKLSGDPADIDHDEADAFTTIEAGEHQKQGGQIYQAELSGVLSPNLLWSVQAGVNRGFLEATPQNGDVATASHVNAATGALYGAYSEVEDSDRNRDELKTNLTWFVDKLAGTHEVKAGVEYSKLSFTDHSYTTADGWRYTDATIGWWEGTDDSTVIPYLLYRDTDPGSGEFAGKLGTAYLQDAWKPTPSLTVKIGARYDQAQMYNDVDTEIASLDKLQPRLGLAWDVTGDAKNLVKASWGRFMHPSATTLPYYARQGLSTSYRWISCSTVRGFASPEQCQAYAAGRGYEWNAGPDGWDPSGWYFRGAADTFGSEPTRVEDGLKASYADELIVGFERELGNKTSVEVTYVDKKTTGLFEDTCAGNLSGLTIDDPDYCNTYVIANLPGLERTYRGAILKFESRAYDWLHLLASYTWSKSEGNLEYSQGAFSDYDFYPDHFVNRDGYLGDDRRHRVKVNGYALLPHQLVVGFDAFWSSAFAYDRTEGAPNAGYGVEYLDPRGAYRGNSNYQLDLSLTKGFKVGPANLQLIGTVYNVLNSERVVEYCENFPACSATVDWGQPSDWQNPRRFEAGFRIEF